MGSSPPAGRLRSFLPPEQTGGQLGAAPRLRAQQRLLGSPRHTGETHLRLTCSLPCQTRTVFLCLESLIGYKLAVPLSPLQEVVSSVSAQYSRGVLWRNSEALVVHLQALCRGFLIRWRMTARRHFLMNQTAAVVVIQVSVSPLGELRLVWELQVCHRCALLCSVSLEEVRRTEGLQTAPAVPLHELESCRQGNSCCS